ncbi:protein with signal peptide plus 12 transmembrane domain domain protein, possible tranporter [Elysia marginata]|uniref:Protein with signal peptide plus 12 transmembrane domain domain protein, possible tranporter n=1 Tax=Elysia marginata TaxID=1093978 RepID=A0AAV4HZX0_9GAST|nr:protein with signal peptide plus 12 transmembrane domain domain protein, possible tranporter [Elysia marginata]
MHCKLTAVQRSWVVIAAGTLLTSSLSMLTYYGNLLPYLASYFQAHRDSMTLYLSALWPSTGYRICLPLSMMITSPLERRFGIRTCITSGQILICISVLAGFFAVGEPLALTLLFGSLQGVSVGVSYTLTCKLLLASVPGKGGFATGVTSIGPAIGSLINMGLAYAVVNPSNIPADLQIGNTFYFSDPVVLDRVPYYFLASGAFTSVTSISGLILLYIGTSAIDKNGKARKPDTQESEKPNCANASCKNIISLNDRNCRLENSLVENSKQNYGSSSISTKSKHGTGKCFLKLENENLVQNLKHPQKRDKEQSLEHYGKESLVISTSANGNANLRFRNNEALSRKPAGTVKNAPYAHLFEQGFNEEDSYLERKNLALYGDGLKSTSRHHNKLNESLVRNGATPLRADTNCIEEKRPAQESASPLSGETEHVTTGLAFNAECDLSPLEALKTGRFWCVWVAYLGMGHTLYVQTNLYKQYGQLIISNDILLVATGLLSTAFMTVTRPSAGAFSDRYGVVPALIVISLVSSLFMNIMVIGVHVGAALYIMASMVEFASVSTMIILVNLLVAALFGRSHFATNVGLVYSATIANVAVEPFVVSWIVSDFGWDWVFLSGSVTAAIAMVIAMLL